MKKAKFLALALAGAITLMGAGYAAWTDTITITSEVDTAMLDVYFHETSSEKPHKIINEIDPLEVASISVGYGSDNGSAGPDTNDVATITVLNLYPGFSANCILTLTNQSEIPIRFDNVESLKSPSSVIPKGVTAELTRIEFIDKDGKMKPFSKDNNYKDIEKTMIPKGEDITFTYTFKGDYTGMDNDTSENKNVNITINPVFKQFNDN
jgi:hypothetical protein